MKYEKTHSDKAREISDIARNPIMRFLKNQEHFKFNIGDVLIKQVRWSTQFDWKTEVIAGVNAPKKFVYVFENELGIGYLKQLRVDGQGFTTTLVCTANFDPDTVRFRLDPDFVDHMLIGDENFEYNKEYLSKKSFRKEAMKNNQKIIVKTRTTKKRIEWLASLKVGDVFWFGSNMDDMYHCKYEVVRAVTDETPLKISAKAIATKRGNENTLGKVFNFDEDYFIFRYVSMKQPFPMEDPLCDHPR